MNSTHNSLYDQFKVTYNVCYCTQCSK